MESPNVTLNLNFSLNPNVNPFLCAFFDVSHYPNIDAFTQTMSTHFSHTDNTITHKTR